MPRTSDTLRFTPRIGGRLRELRLRAGFTQRDLSAIMGRAGPHLQSRLSRLERGRIAFPTLAFIADYLRACRASFSDLADILDKYTSLAPVPDREGMERVSKFTRKLPYRIEKKVSNYDIHSALERQWTGKKPLDPATREQRARKLASSWFARHKLDAWLEQAILDFGLLPTAMLRYEVHWYGRKAWRILDQTRDKPGRKRRPRKDRKTREQRLDEAERTATERRMLSPARLRYIRDSTTTLFLRMEKNGELDRLLTAEDARRIPPPPDMHRKPRSHSSSAPLAGVDPREAKRAKCMAWVRLNVNTRMREAGIDMDRRTAWFGWLSNIVLIAQETEDDPEERDRRTRAAVALARDKKLAARVAAWFYVEYGRMRPKWER